jgi:S-(hydroxymethyl)glutathione dehydrogenase/alcohol dehydrogenase
MKALVTREMNQYSVEDLKLDPPKAGELRIKMGATGVCHSDLSVINGTLPLGKPMVLGHEGAGIVAELGAGVTGFSVGDHVVLSFAPACGVCHFCKTKQPQFCTIGAPHGRMLDGTARVHEKGGADVGVMQFLGCMAEESIVPAISACVIDKSIPLDRARWSAAA